MYFLVVVLCVHVKYSWRLSGKFLGKKTIYIILNVP
jgi:hypothetical protein